MRDAWSRNKRPPPLITARLSPFVIEFLPT